MCWIRLIRLHVFFLFLLFRKWSIDGFKHYHKIAHSAEGPEAGIQPITIYHMYSGKELYRKVNTIFFQCFKRYMEGGNNKSLLCTSIWTR